ncbi:MAG TPA: hypothetical protein VE956_00065 [Nodularia sp. (in: cyanobacteria)]|nr:hypothetical protein [Nodularia sp. (in: cyanobacteria)]
MSRNGTLAVQPESAEIEPQIKTLTRSKKSETTAPIEPSTAIAIEELDIAFDADLRASIIQGLIRNKDLILQESKMHRQTAKAVELGRLEAIEKAKLQGRTEAQQEMLAKRKRQQSDIQKRFIEVELPQLLDSCEHFAYESLKEMVNTFAAGVGVQLEWKELENGQFQCTPRLG